jgi:hypothetical protein
MRVECVVLDQTEEHLEGSACQPSPDQCGFLLRAGPLPSTKLWIADMPYEKILDSTLHIRVRLWAAVGPGLAKGDSHCRSAVIEAELFSVGQKMENPSRYACSILRLAMCRAPVSGALTGPPADIR